MPTAATKLFRSLLALLIIGLGSVTSYGAQVIRIGNAAEPKNLDPQTEVGVPESRIIWNLFEGLVGKDPQTLKPVPAVAESWTQSKDGKVYTFKLRRDAKWSNGEPLTAEDFVYSWRRLLSPELASVYAYYGFFLKNGKDYNSGKIKNAAEVGVKALDPYTLQATLESPTPFFLDLMFHQSMYPVPKKTIEKFGNRWTRPGNLVSNGAFVLDKWEVNKLISLKKSPIFWDRAKVVLDQANFYPVENANTEERMFRTGELDVTSTIPTEKIPFWQKDKTGVYNQWPMLATYAYKVNVTKAPLNDVRVRRALALAINRDKIVKYVLRAGQIPATAFTPPGTGGYTPDARLPTADQEIAAAKKLLAEAGYPGGKGMPPVEILYNTDEGHKKIAEAVQQMWKLTLGVDVTLMNQEWKVLLDNDRTGNFQLIRFSWIGDYDDPSTYLSLFETKEGNNHTGWFNARYSELVKKADNEFDAKKRLDYFRQAENILMDELPLIPIYIYTRNYLKSTKVQGWYPNLQDIHQLKYVSLAAKETK